ncbi:MAG: hypothetical protein ACFC1C_00390 [Candidatus Malihini olakiniferum]
MRFTRQHARALPTQSLTAVYVLILETLLNEHIERPILKTRCPWLLMISLTYGGHPLASEAGLGVLDIAWQ